VVFPLCALRIADVISGGIPGALVRAQHLAMEGVMMYQRDF
jgi:hypothetical protein